MLACVLLLSCKETHVYIPLYIYRISGVLFTSSRLIFLGSDNINSIFESEDKEFHAANDVSHQLDSFFDQFEINTNTRFIFPVYWSALIIIT